jgi:nucleoside-diphosphate-sugar epimerase
VKALVTGATGFIGGILCRSLQERGHAVRAAVRHPQAVADLFSQGIEVVAVGSIGKTTDWKTALSGCEAVFHCAGLAHGEARRRQSCPDQYREINTEGTKKLAETAAAQGVHRLVYVSSIGVLGNQTDGDSRFSEKDQPRPQGPYAISKWEAETHLRKVERNSGLEGVVVRPPLVYGAGAKGNFPRLVKWVSSGWPLPLASIRNRRAWVSVGNLVDLLIRCGEDPRAKGKTFLVADEEETSTPDFVRRIALAWGVPARLFPMPTWFLRMAGRWIGKSSEVARLVGSLRLDIRWAKTELGWHPRFSMAQELKNAAQSWRAYQGAREKI